MQIAPISETDHADFLANINAEIRPDRANTNAWDDFPLILGIENLDWGLGAFNDDGALVAGLACLIREIKTSCGILPVAGIGSVFTKPEHRGQGFSTALQIEMLERLRRNKIPLAVLWTDKPEIYAGRGFTSAGYEFHIDFTQASIPGGIPAGFQVSPFLPEHLNEVEALFHSHCYHTVRKPGDSKELYFMPGTRGFVLIDSSDKVQAYVFCGKGGDFPFYVPEWGGDTRLVLHLLHEVRKRGLAHQVLVPAGAMGLAEILIKNGAQWATSPSGYWKVVDTDILESALGNSISKLQPGQLENPAAILGFVDAEGAPNPGILELAIWGFDSV